MGGSQITRHMRDEEQAKRPARAQMACSEPFNVTREELAAATGFDATEVASTLDTLVSRGYVERIGEDCYRLVMPE